MSGFLRTFCLIPVCAFIALLVQTTPVLAASAAAYGNKVVQSHNAPSREVAVQKALENCSMADTYCKILVKCENNGFGAVATERVGGLITAAGAVCAADTPEAARDAAVKKCMVNNLRENCKLRTQWHDDGATN